MTTSSEFIAVFRRRIANLRARGLQSDHEEADRLEHKIQLYKHAAGL